MTFAKSAGLLLIFAALSSRDASGFSIYWPADVHQIITKRSLCHSQYQICANLEATLNDGTKIPFSDRAIDEIVAANVETDDLQGPEHAYLHFDDESFESASSTLVADRLGLIRDLSSSRPDGASARRTLGRMLHSLQDFYAHSNHVEKYGAFPEYALGLSTISTERIQTGETCLDNGGTLQPDIGLTSGYVPHWSTLYFCPDSFATKCLHGPPVPGSPCGINKDVPLRLGYEDAFDTAAESTTLFVGSVIRELEARPEAIRDAALCALLDGPANKCDKCPEGKDENHDGECDQLVPVVSSQIHSPTLVDDSCWVSKIRYLEGCNNDHVEDDSEWITMVFQAQAFAETCWTPEGDVILVPTTGLLSLFPPPTPPDSRSDSYSIGHFGLEYEERYWGPSILSIYSIVVGPTGLVRGTWDLISDGTSSRPCDNGQPGSYTITGHEEAHCSAEEHFDACWSEEGECLCWSASGGCFPLDANPFQVVNQESCPSIGPSQQ